MSDIKVVTTTQEKLLALMPDALIVIKETIRAEYSLVDEEGKDKPWPAPALNTSIWLIEKLTGKAKTEDVSADTGLLRQVLQTLNDRKSSTEANLLGKQILSTPHNEDRTKDFVDKY